MIVAMQETWTNELWTAFNHLYKDPYMHVFLWMVIGDIFTGLAKGVKEKKANSTIGLNGLIRHLLIVAMVMVLATYLPVFGFDTIKTWFLGYFIVMYLISLIENIGILGIPLPAWLKDYIYKLQKQYDTEEIDFKDVESIKVKQK